MVEIVVRVGLLPRIEEVKSILFFNYLTHSIGDLVFILILGYDGAPTSSRKY